MTEQSADYPPLTPLDEYPLHGWDYNADYACQGGGDVYDWRCHACVDIAAERSAYGHDPMTLWRQSADSEERRVTLGWLIARSRAHGIKS